MASPAESSDGQTKHSRRISCDGQPTSPPSGQEDSRIRGPTPPVQSSSGRTQQSALTRGQPPRAESSSRSNQRSGLGRGSTRAESSSRSNQLSEVMPTWQLTWRTVTHRQSSSFHLPAVTQHDDGKLQIQHSSL